MKKFWLSISLIVITSINVGMEIQIIRDGKGELFNYFHAAASILLALPILAVIARDSIIRHVGMIE